MRHTPLTLVVAFLACMAPGSAGAQADDPTSPRVLLQPPRGPLIRGDLLRLDLDSVAVFSDHKVVVLSRERTRVYVGTPRPRSRATWQRGATGFVLGAVAGALVGGHGGDCSGSNCGVAPSSSDYAMAGALVLGFLGGTAGAVSGVIAPGTEWRAVPRDARDLPAPRY